MDVPRPPLVLNFDNAETAALSVDLEPGQAVT
jgi:hypothetical protein